MLDNAGMAHQSQDTGRTDRLQFFQAHCSNATVFVNNRHNVRNGTDCNDIRIAIANTLCIAVNRTQKLKDHAYARKIFEGIGAILSVRIYHRNRIGNDLAAIVMIGDHHIDPLLLSVKSLVDSGDAGVNGDDHIHSANHPLDNGQTKTVSLGDAIGNEILAFNASAGKIIVQHHSRGNAVYVVIAVNANPLLVVDRATNSFHCAIHILEKIRIVERNFVLV